MSAIALPLVFSNTVTNPITGANSEPVNADHIMNIGVLDTPEVENYSRSPRFAIVITVLSTDNQSRTVTWEYADAVDRDAALVALYAAVAVAI